MKVFGMNKELEKAAFDYINSEVVSAENMQLAFGDFINGAEWMLERVCKYLENEHPTWYEHFGDELKKATSVASSFFITQNKKDS